jgi:uncharacterized membrane protein
MEIFTQTGGVILSRWGHYLAGVTWIGLLYYFNFVQVPSFAAFEAGPRTEAVRKLVPRALWWFRWGAVLTLLTGVSILAFQEQLDDMEYFKTGRGISIATGILLALVMFSNVWGVIWPNQKKFVANAEATTTGGEADPNAAAYARKALCASRTNTLFSIPMLFFMGATGHFAKSSVPASGDRAMYWVVLLVLVVLIELIALRAPAADSATSWHLDSHRNTIIAGFVLWAILILQFENLF